MSTDEKPPFIHEKAEVQSNHSVSSLKSGKSLPPVTH